MEPEATIGREEKIIENQVKMLYLKRTFVLVSFAFKKLKPKNLL